ncbi:hypothetical protein MXB_5423 [Myxobolus squamalis]|nr:hypothetical protein MXB_5423 [Myxobolus squamalis]
MNTLIQFTNPGSIQINLLDNPNRNSVKVLHEPIFYKVKISVPTHQKPINFKYLKISLIGTISSVLISTWFDFEFEWPLFKFTEFLHFDINEVLITSLMLKRVKAKLKHTDISNIRTELMTTEA